MTAIDKDALLAAMPFAGLFDIELLTAEAEGVEGTLEWAPERTTNFFRAIRNGTVRGVARPVHVGRRTIGVQTEVHDPNDRLVSLTFQTQAVLT
jgi:uncharacterized protein (TIGR00369 family)